MQAPGLSLGSTEGKKQKNRAKQPAGVSLETVLLGAGEMAKWLRKLVLAEDLGSIPSMMAHKLSNSINSSGDILPLF